MISQPVNTYLPGRHVRADLSDYEPGVAGTVFCFKCGAARSFTVGPRGALHLGPWTKGGKRTPRCPQG